MRVNNHFETFECPLERVWTILDDYWLYLIISQTTIIELILILPNILLSGRIRLRGDGMIFSYFGYLMTRGYTPYIDMFDIKPPLVYEFGYVTTVLSGGDPYWQAVLSIVICGAAVVVIVALVGWIVYHETGNPTAAYAAGTVPLVIPRFYTYAATGFRPKYLTVMFGLLAITLLVRRRPFASGASSALAAGFWQFGILFPAVVLWSYKKRRREAGWTILGILVVTVVALVPIALGGSKALLAMIEQVILAPIISPEPTQLDRHLRPFFTRRAGAALPIIVLGLVGTLCTLTRDHSDTLLTWLPIGAAWAIVQVLWLDFDGVGPDIYLLLVVAALGYGLWADQIGDETTAVLAVVLVAGIMFIGHGVLDSYGFIIRPFPSDVSLGRLERLYWMQPEPTACHINRARVEKLFIYALDGSTGRTTCYYDFWRVVRTALGP